MLSLFGLVMSVAVGDKVAAEEIGYAFCKLFKRVMCTKYWHKIRPNRNGSHLISHHCQSHVNVFSKFIAKK